MDQCSSSYILYLGKTFSASGEIVSLHSTSFKKSSSSVLLNFGDIIDGAEKNMTKCIL